MEFDVVVAGSGAAGLTAAIRAAKAGLSVIVLEKAGSFGGTTAVSGGGVWIPDSPQARAAGVDDSVGTARDYLLGVLGDRANRALIEAYLSHGPEMIDWLAQNSSVRFSLGPPMSDWRPDLPGARAHGRLLAPVEYDGKRLGRDFLRLSRPREEFNAPGGMMIDLTDLPYLQRLPAPDAVWRLVRIATRFAVDKARFGRGSRLTMGNALVARLLRSALDAGVELRERAALKGLVAADGRITGVEAEIDGAPVAIAARRGVVLAAGGFSHNRELKQAYIPYPDQTVSMLPYDNTGDGIMAGRTAGGTLGDDNFSAASWTVVSTHRRADGYLERYAHLMDMAKPGCIAVDAGGRRFANEASVHFVKAMQQAGAVPAHLVANAAFVKRYGFGLSLAGGRRIKALVQDGYLAEAATLGELAGKIGVDPAGLEATAARVEALAQGGEDLDFGKGATPIDREMGDARRQPNPCFGPLGEGPYYAIRIFPGDGSPAIGLKIDEQCRVLDGGGSPISGLWAAGLDANSIWKGATPAHGCGVGPAMVTGYIAAKSILAAPGA